MPGAEPSQLLGRLRPKLSRISLPCCQAVLRGNQHARSERAASIMTSQFDSIKCLQTPHTVVPNCDSEPGEWLSVAAFAKLHGVTRQAISQALSRCAQGLPWRGGTIVRRVHQGRGGSRGRNYLVRLEPFCEDAKPETFKRKKRKIFSAAANSLTDWRDRWSILERAASFPENSRERRQELIIAAELADRSVRTLERWLKRLKDHDGDVLALSRKRPSNAGASRVLVSQTVDKAWAKAKLPKDQLRELADFVDRSIKGLWQDRVGRAGWRSVQTNAQTAVEIWLEERGLQVDLATPFLPENKIRKHIHHRQIDERANHRKKHDDNKPRISRNAACLRPMELVVLDVKFADNQIQRPDGSVAFPREIAFLDMGTQRSFVRHFLLPPRQNITQSHVAEAFIAMVLDPAWGMPEALLFDRGGENGALKYLAPYLARLGSKRAVLQSLPYNASAKPVEGTFARHDVAVASQLDGYVAGARMDQRKRSPGKTVKPYAKGFETYEREFSELLADYELREIASGVFKGRSPRKIFADWIGRGWRPRSVEANVLDAVFSKREAKRIRQGRIRIGENTFRHDLLPLTRSVVCAIPFRKGVQPLFELGPDDWVSLEIEDMFHPLDPAGAAESSRRQRDRDRRLRALKQEAITPDTETYRRRRLAEQEVIELPDPIECLPPDEGTERMAAAMVEADDAAEAVSVDRHRRAARDFILAGGSYVS